MNTTDFTLIEKNTPLELKELKQWILWKKNKIPVTINDSPASTTNHNDWSTFDEAMKEAAESSQCRGIKGLGFVFVATNGIVGIDLDSAVDENGIKPWAIKVLNLFENGYIEYSPSGKGFHIIVRGKKPGAKCKRVIEDSRGNELGAIEMYEAARYFTITGQIWRAGFDKLVNAQPQINYIYERVFGGTQNEGVKEPNHTGELVNTDPVRIGEHVLVKDLPAFYQVVRRSVQADKFKALTEGSLESALGLYGNDHSRAVYALCSIVAFYTDNFTIMDSVFQGSPLFAKKWAEGKWKRLGASQFSKLRNEYVSKGNFYNPEAGRVSPSEDFTEEEVIAEKSRGELEYERHIELLWLEHTEARKDLLSNALFLRHQYDGWTAAFNRSTLSALRGECQVRGKLYKKTKLEDYMARYASTLKPELLIDIPIWDGTDRIGEMCKRIQTRDVDNKVFEELFKDWCAKAWGRIFNPNKVQNRCIILSGAQGIGKDMWIKSMFCGLDKYLTDLTLSGGFSKETDIAVVMASSLVMFISEFDKTNMIGVETLKDLVTKDSFNFVRKYDREASLLQNRCSIIAACNPDHVLRDVTGNRRFLVFKIDGLPGDAIKWTYPFMDSAFSLQVIAECRNLWEAGYSASKESEDIMSNITRRYTPMDANAEIVFDFESMIENRISGDMVSGVKAFRVETLGLELDTLCKNFGMPRKGILAVLKGAGCQYRDKSCRYYSSRELIQELIDLEERNGNDIQKNLDAGGDFTDWISGVIK